MAKDYAKYEINELRFLAKERGINTSGLSKTIIIRRLNAWDTIKARKARQPAGLKKLPPNRPYQLGRPRRKPARPRRKPADDNIPYQLSPPRNAARLYNKDRRIEPAQKHKSQRMTARKELLSHCGPRCFADDDTKYAICPYCTSKSCSCYPECEGLQAAYNKGINPDLMQLYAETLKCKWLQNIKYSPIKSREIRSRSRSRSRSRRQISSKRLGERLFAEGQWIVGFKSESGFKVPWFGKVKHISKNGNIKITPYESVDQGLVEWIMYAWENNYKDWTPDEIVRERPKFMVSPSDKRMKSPKVIQTNAKGFWKDHQVHFKPYNKKDVYEREYTAKEIQKVINTLLL